jgi:hypothetical protein
MNYFQTNAYTSGARNVDSAEYFSFIGASAIAFSKADHHISHGLGTSDVGRWQRRSFTT